MTKKAYIFKKRYSSGESTLNLDSICGYETSDNLEYFNFIFTSGTISTEYKMTSEVKELLEGLFKTNFK